jgi:hypothetical protein
VKDVARVHITSMTGLGKPNENWRDLISSSSIPPQVMQSIL